MRLDEKAYANCPSDSIDYALMEKTKVAAVVPLPCAWSDIGSWHSLWESGQRDSSGNVAVGDVVTMNTTDCYLHSENRLLTTIGLKDCVVVETADAVMVAKLNQSEHVKALVTQLRLSKRDETQRHRRVFRPWGYYDLIAEGTTFKVKKLSVHPGAKLSLQLHRKRSEHWIVISGQADIVKDETTLQLDVNQSTFIPCGIKHRLMNNTKTLLEIIEVQTGDYLEEDDIVRFEDQYKRLTT